MKKLTISVVCALGIAGSTGAANAAVTVFGGGLARECYEAVESGNSPRETMDTCNLALEQERLTPRDRAATHVNRGIIHMRQGRLEMALQDYSISARIQPDLADAQVNRGAALYGLRRYEEALEALNVGVNAENVNARSVAHYNRGLTNEKLGLIEAAYHDFRDALEIQPDFELAARQLERFEVIPAAD